jgi:hypothetical protein
MGKESGCDETQAHNISSRQKENRGGTAGTVGEGEGAAEEVAQFLPRAHVGGFSICGLVFGRRIFRARVPLNFLHEQTCWSSPGHTA